MPSTAPRIYVASLSDYNAGNLHGVWIDATLDPDAIEEQIRAMLFESREPNVTRCRACGMTRSGLGTTPEECENNQAPGRAHVWHPSAEEYAIHDSEGFGEVKLSEFESIEQVSELANAIEEHGEIFAKYIEHTGEKDVSDAVSDFQDHYRGVYRSLEDYAEQFLEDTGAFQGALDLCRRYFDFQAFARDLELGGDVFTIDLDGQVHVFDAH